VWSCKGAESNTPFEEVELSLDEPDGWMDYDEKVSPSSIPFESSLTLYTQSGLPVGVTEFESKIERA
jgi:hypothetical protein